MMRRTFHGAHAMLWLKAFHIVFVVAWFAGLFYLPRLFVYHVDANDGVSHERFVVMERRLLAITHVGGALALGFGIALLLAWLRVAPGYAAQGWLHAKLALVALLVAYHFACMRLARGFALGANRRSARWYRLFNEVPALALIAIVVLVVVKPF
jgi:protoporphyrinogen IX oxidase